MRVLVTGRTGQVGTSLARHFTDPKQALFLDRSGFDMTRPGGLAQVLDRENPSVIINAAAYTAVDAAEEDRETAFTVNAKAVGVLAQWAARNDALLVHYSTDYVFSGDADTPWTEAATTAPVNAYGESKLAGEDAVRSAACRHLILRTAWVYSAQGKNFAKTMLRLAAERDSLRVVADQRGTPTSADWIAAATSRMVDRFRLGSAPADRDTVNVVCAGETTWHGFATAIIEAAKQRGLPVKAATVEGITTAEFPTPAKRPAYSVLDTTRLRSVWGLEPPEWRDELDRVMDQIAENGTG